MNCVCILEKVLISTHFYTSVNTWLCINKWRVLIIILAICLNMLSYPHLHNLIFINFYAYLLLSIKLCINLHFLCISQHWLSTYPQFCASLSTIYFRKLFEFVLIVGPNRIDKQVIHIVIHTMLCVLWAHTCFN